MQFVDQHMGKLIAAGALLFLLLVASLEFWHHYQLHKNIKADVISGQQEAAQQAAFFAQPRNASSTTVRSLMNANLLGVARVDNPQPVAKVVPQTTLNLTLVGAIYASNPSQARALIRAGSKRTKVYSIGDQIEGVNARLKEIRTAEVIIDRAGASESLLIDRDNSLASAGGPSPAQYRSKNNIQSANRPKRNMRKNPPRKLRAPNIDLN